MRKKTVVGIIADFGRRKATIAKERDCLRLLQGDLEDMAERCDTAIENIEAAIDALSELV